MPGHRRASNSTVETVDSAGGNSRPTYHETTILRQLKDIPDNADSDNWPCFVLSNATVYHKDGKRMANPLLALPEKPIVVRGKLEVDQMEPDERTSLINPKSKPVNIEIKTSKLFSIDSDIRIWVSGESGWFEIVPAPQYLETFGEAREAAKLYYNLLEVHENHQKAAKRKRQKSRPPPQPTLDEILFKFAYEAADGMFREEAEQRCHKYASFLIGHCLKDAFNWEDTDFYKWIIHEHPDLYKKALKMMSAQGQQPKQASATEKAPSPDTALPVGKPSATFLASHPATRASSEISQDRGSRSRRQTQETPDVEMKDAPSTSLSNSTRYSSKNSGVPTKPSQSPAAEIQQSTPTITLPASVSTPTMPGISTPVPGTSSIADMLVNVLEEIIVKLNVAPNRISKSAVHSNLYYSWRIKNYHSSSEIVAYYSRELLQKLGPEWQGSGFYTWLAEEAKNPPKELVHTTVEDLPRQLVRRAQKQVVGKASNTPASSSRSKLEIRPKSTPTARQQKSGSDSDSDSEDTGRRRALKGGLRMTSASKKRKASDLVENDVEESSGRRGRKSVKYDKYYYNLDEDIEAESDSDDVASPQAADDDDDDLESLSIPKDVVRVVIHAEKLPTMSPTGPNGTWVCDHEDCGYVVRAAEEEAGQATIREHFRGHEMATEKVALALNEGRRGHMPINHLLEKIQALGKKSLDEKKQKIDGIVVPPPIKRRLLV